MNRLDEYETKKQHLLKHLSQNEGEFSLKKKTSNLFRTREPSKTKKIDVSHFNQVISIDPTSLTAVVEGMITYEDLVRETLKYNTLPPVVPQLKTITLGGALVGLGIESSSFLYGLVHETILEIEVLLGNGITVICTPHNEHSDLFYAFPNSYGTLGYALKITLQLIPAKKFVRLTNQRFHDAPTYFHTLKELCSNKKNTYIDGVIFSPDEMYIILAEFVDQAPYVSDYTYMHIYYKSIQQQETNYLTTHDYIWRWDPDWFWCSKHFGMHHPLLRFLFGKFALNSSFYWKVSHFLASHPPLKRLSQLFSKPSESVIQDILIPIDNSQKFYEFLHSSLRISPLWICPFQSSHPDRTYSLFNIDPKTLYIDFGFWEIVPSNQPQGFLNRLVEKKTEELKGFKSLYSDAFYTEEEFWRLHPQQAFLQLKAKYDPKSTFKDLYEKCVKN
jgi:FAD/FMN-containing dehydrogenase